MLETITIILLGLIPGLISSYVITTKVRRYTRSNCSVGTERLDYHLQSLQLQFQDYRYVEGLGYMLGDITCEFNARSAYLRCAINPGGPCEGCSHYQSIHFPEELEGGLSLKSDRSL